LRKKKYFFFFPILLILLLIVPCFTLVDVLILDNVYSGEKYFLNIVSNGASISVEFLHSYDKDHVVEIFEVEDNMFKPVKVVYSSDTYDYRELRYNSTSRIEYGRIVLYIKDNVRFKSITYQIAYLAPQKLTVTVDDESYEYYLQWFGKKGEAVKLEVVKIPYIMFMIYRRGVNFEK